MSDISPKHEFPEEGHEPREIASSLDRYDLTGNLIRRWTTNARDRLATLLNTLCKWASNTSNSSLPGDNRSIGDTVAKLPSKGLRFVEAQADKTTVDNQLKMAQTETEFLKQELHRQQIAKTKAETEAQYLDNLARQIEIQERLREITRGKSEMQVIFEGDRPVVVVANLPQLAEEAAQQSEPIHINSLGLPLGVQNTLTKHKIETTNDLTSLTRAQLLKLSRVGEKSVEIIELHLSRIGLKLKD